MYGTAYIRTRLKVKDCGRGDDQSMQEPLFNVNNIIYTYIYHIYILHVYVYIYIERETPIHIYIQLYNTLYVGT